MAPNLDQQVKMGTESFKLTDIEADPKKIIQITQGKMFDITPVEPKKAMDMPK